MTGVISKCSHILVVDDDATLRMLTRTALEQVGFLVTEAADGREAVDVALRSFPDAILMDVEMPELDGFAACAQIRRHPDCLDTPIVMLTGRDDDESIREAYDCGATDFIPKPINWSLLGQRVMYIVRASQVSRGLRDSESKNQAFVQAIPDSMLVVNRQGQLLTHHRGSSGSRLIDDLVTEGDSIFEALPKSLADVWRTQISRVLDTRGMELSEHRAKKNAAYHFYESRVVPYTDKSVLIMLRDVTEQKQAAAKVRRLAFYDTLTGLPNRQSFLIQLAEAIREAEDTEGRIGVLYLDLDNFKLINDSLGHNIGDRLLKGIAKRLSSSVRRDDYVATTERDSAKMQVSRLGGDEFTVLLRGLNSVEEVEAVAERTVSVLKEPMSVDGHQFVITPSVGMSVYPDDGQDLETLMKNTDTALHHAKAAGRDRVTRFSGTMSIRSLERLDIEDSLRRAIENGELELHYQPKMVLANRDIPGVEALVRWTHPDRGPISPAKFIPIAEDSGMIMALSEWVMHEACNQLQAWQGTELDRVRIAINLSAKQFNLDDLHSQIFSALNTRQIPFERLELELTEGALMRDIDSTIHSLQRLKDAGLLIAVDDFGTGYSSMSYLKRFPLDALKIDRSFVDEIEKSRESHAICKAIVELGHGLGLKVIAEGVENGEQVTSLNLMDCDQLQGYFFARPMPASEVTRFISDHVKRHLRRLPLANL
ncbi:MAG: EAL domain-containing protein [Pseudomonadota bacterium]